MFNPQCASTRSNADTLSDAGKNTILNSRRSFRGSRPTPSINQVSPGADRKANVLSICDRANDDGDDENGRIDVNRALSTPSASADDMSGLTILEAVRNPVSKDKFEAIMNNYPPGHMLRFLSSSNVVENTKPGTMVVLGRMYSKALMVVLRLARTPR